MIKNEFEKNIDGLSTRARNIIRGVTGIGWPEGKDMRDHLETISCLSEKDLKNSKYACCGEKTILEIDKWLRQFGRNLKTGGLEEIKKNDEKLQNRINSAIKLLEQHGYIVIPNAH